MYIYDRYMSDVHDVATLSANEDAAVSFIYNFHLLTKEAVKGTCWETIHAALPLSPIEIAKRVCEVLLFTSERLPTFLEKVKKENNNG